MIYEIILSASAMDALSKLNQNTQKRIVSVLERIRFRLERYVSRLVGEPGYKLRVRDYRLILDINRNKIIILMIYKSI